MAGYHKYVFDANKRKFIGRFEEMYQNETREVFDSWHQEDSRQTNRKTALDILSFYNFQNILDIGTGKAALTHSLKKVNNTVKGIDISPTAVELARSRYPDIRFEVADANDISKLCILLDSILKNDLSAQKFDLVFTAECLSYIPQWRELIAALSFRTVYLMIVLFIPNNPIGFVKSVDELEKEVRGSFQIIEHVTLKTSNFVIIFGQSLHKK